MNTDNICMLCTYFDEVEKTMKKHYDANFSGTKVMNNQIIIGFGIHSVVCLKKVMNSCKYEFEVCMKINSYSKEDKEEYDRNEYNKVLEEQIRELYEE